MENSESVVLMIKVGKTSGKLTADLLKWTIRKYLSQSQNLKIHHGKQAVKQLARQGAGVQNIEIRGKSIKSFERVAQKYGVDFALKKDPTQGEISCLFQGTGRGHTKCRPCRVCRKKPEPLCNEETVAAGPVFTLVFFNHDSKATFQDKLLKVIAAEHSRRILDELTAQNTVTSPAQGSGTAASDNTSTAAKAAHTVQEDGAGGSAAQGYRA